jgi:type IV pilus assembly protein PilB
MTEKQMLSMLTERSYINKEQSAEYLAINPDNPISEMIKDEVFTPILLAEAMAGFYKVKALDLDHSYVDDDVLKLLPYNVAKSKQAVCIGRSYETFVVAMTEPNDAKKVKWLQEKIGHKFEVRYLFPDFLETALGFYQDSLVKEVNNIVNEFEEEDFVESIYRDDAVVRIVDKILEFAVKENASDIHISPRRSVVEVRFRLDGMMRKVLNLSKKYQEAIVSRIKILSKLRTDEHATAQDGNIRYAYEGGIVDVRISIVPLIDGENVVMRMFPTQVNRLRIDNLGLSDKDREVILKACKLPYGMILATGPTGSGKTTTFYSILRLLNKEEVHIYTIEDPIEYDISGVSQIQVNNKTGLTFAEGLRAIVRQDPDIIMVGEIRDRDTADISVNAALTGHLVLSTFHANDAATALPRLIDMGVEPFLVTSTIRFVLAQRLVRQICEKCKTEHILLPEEVEAVGQNEYVKSFLKRKKKSLKSLKFFKGTGCMACGGTGYKGRTGIFEIIEVSDKIRRLVLASADSKVIQIEAKKAGMRTFFEDGFDKAMKGITSVHEVLRVSIS